MMKLKTMVRGLDGDIAAAAAMAFWEHDKGSLVFFRASTNFVYLFKRNGEIAFLRFSCDTEADAGQIAAELDFVRYLGQRGYSAVQPVASDNGNLIENVHTVHGSYYAVVFEKAKGARLDRCKLDEADYERYGQSLASLHVLSRSYVPSANAARHNWQERLHFVRSVLRDHKHETDAAAELDAVEAWLGSMPVDEDGYGLCHYDFERDNVFWDSESRQFSVIDFDDATMHWFLMDVAGTLEDLEDAGSEEAFDCKEAFLRGYGSVKGWDLANQALLTKFRRFSALYGFARVVRAMDGSAGLDSAPHWYEGLRTKLTDSLEADREGFRQPW